VRGQNCVTIARTQRSRWLVVSVVMPRRVDHGRRIVAEKHDVRMRRIYDDPAADDGIRVLVDRRWPRGVSKARAELDEWCTQVAPSDTLRKWYGHDPAK